MPSILAWGLVGCASAPPEVDTSPVAESPAPPAPPPPTAEPTGPAPSAAGPLPAGPPPAIVLERQRCRSSAPAYRLTIEQDGRVRFEGEANVVALGVSQGAMPAEEARALGAKLVAGGLATWGHARCDPNGSARCSMHPCALTLSAWSDGRMLSASRTHDAPASPRGLTDAVAEVERAARVWQWVRPDTTAGAPSECSSAHDCTVGLDRCGGLHAQRNGERTEHEVVDCAASAQPKAGVEPACLERQCALVPVLGDQRTCRADGECMAVASGCNGWLAIRRDPAFVRRIATRNDHLRCSGARDPAPRVACLRGTCVTRAGG